MDRQRRPATGCQRERLALGDEPSVAALSAGATRLRPVLMTALAMIAGMLPMALGWGTHDLSSEISKRTLKWATTAAAVSAAALLAGGSLRLFANERQARSLQAQTDVNLKRTVTTINAQPADPTRSINLPATLRGNEESIIYVRTTGYVAAWHKTIGDQVRKGELLAELSAPEQEQALRPKRT